jgi:hypothetical protein
MLDEQLEDGWVIRRHLDHVKEGAVQVTVRAGFPDLVALVRTGASTF